jgi:hypothetical protein
VAQRHVVLAVRVRAQQHRVRLAVVRSEHVDTQPDSVAHRYRHVPFHGRVLGRVGDGDVRVDQAAQRRQGASPGAVLIADVLVNKVQCVAMTHSKTIMLE